MEGHDVCGPHAPLWALCLTWLDMLMKECARLGVPIASHKTEGPATIVTFLGIKIDTGKGEVCLPQDKLKRLRDLLIEWGDRKGCTRKELESLIGLLNYAYKVVRAGRSFLRRMIDLLHAVHRPPSSKTPIRLSQGFRADLAWWREFLGLWNRGVIPHPSLFPPKGGFVY